MAFVSPSPHRAPLWRTYIPVLAALLLAGCQSYEPAPLDIEAYRKSLDARLIDTEPISAFAHRLKAAGEDVPSRFDPSDGISHAEGEVLALFYNPDLRIARLKAGVALATWDNAGLWKDPVFGFDGAEIISPSSPFEYGLMGSLTIPISGRLEVEKERAGAAYEAQLRSLVDAEWRTRAELRRRWAAWAAAVEQTGLLADTITQLEEINDLADNLEAAGELNRVERRLLHIELADRMVQVTEKELLMLEAKAELLQVLGLPPDATDLLLPDFPNTPIPEFDDVTARLIDANTELAVHFAEYRIAEDTLRLEIKKQFPDIVIGSGYGTEFNDHRVMFGMSIPIPILNANRAAIAEAQAQREVARATAETTFARLFQRLTTAHRVLQVKRTQRDRYEQQIVPLLTEQARDIEQIAALGELDMFVLLETVTRTLDAKQNLIELQVAELDAAITLRRILGPDARKDPSPVTTETNPDQHVTNKYDAKVTGATQ
jgi:cobalt-zinc-cadmium efflux system outer membrane protein